MKVWVLYICPCIKWRHSVCVCTFVSSRLDDVPACSFTDIIQLPYLLGSQFMDWSKSTLIALSFSIFTVIREYCFHGDWKFAVIDNQSIYNHFFLSNLLLHWATNISCCSEHRILDKLILLHSDTSLHIVYTFALQSSLSFATNKAINK